MNSKTANETISQKISEEKKCVSNCGMAAYFPPFPMMMKAMTSP